LISKVDVDAGLNSATHSDDLIHTLDYQGGEEIQKRLAVLKPVWFRPGYKEYLLKHR